MESGCCKIVRECLFDRGEIMENPVKRGNIDRFWDIGTGLRPVLS